jgi:O-antigen/teichoic acid export membrane protein
VRVMGASAALNVLLNALLIPRFGVLGAATATAVTNLIWNLVLLRSVRTVLKIDSTALGRI